MAHAKSSIPDALLSLASRIHRQTDVQSRPDSAGGASNAVATALARKVTVRDVDFHLVPTIIGVEMWRIVIEPADRDVTIRRNGKAQALINCALASASNSSHGCPVNST